MRIAEKYRAIHHKVIADRSERRSIIVSTNLAFSDWLSYRSFVLNMNSDRPYRAEFAAQSENPAKAKAEEVVNQFSIKVYLTGKLFRCQRW